MEKKFGEICWIPTVLLAYYWDVISAFELIIMFFFQMSLLKS